MEEAPENGKEPSYSAHAIGMNKWTGDVGERVISYKIMCDSVISRKINAWPQVCTSNLYPQPINTFSKLYKLVRL
jgi:hypothetical protein